jgi:hypothetical protein
VLGQHFERQVLPKFACAIAVDVRRELRRSQAIATISAWKVNRKGEPHAVVAQDAPTSDAIELFRFKVAEIRKRARAGLWPS